VRRLALVLAAALGLGACSVEALPSTPPTSPGSSMPSPPAPTALLADELVNPGFGLPYACAGEPFDVRIFSMPPTAEISADPAVDGLRKTLRQDPILPRSGWWLIGRSETEAEFASRNPHGAFDYVRVELRDGAWNIHSWGGCGPRLRVEGVSTAFWHLDPSVPLPGPQTRVVRAVVTEHCVPEPLVGRLEDPIIRMTADIVLVAFTARPPAGLNAALPQRRSATLSRTSRALHDICMGHSFATVDVDLGEPLGDRLLLDGSFWPGRDARQPVEP
jgi:hypothetical protein